MHSTEVAYTREFWRRKRYYGQYVLNDLIFFKFVARNIRFSFQFKVESERIEEKSSEFSPIVKLSGLLTEVSPLNEETNENKELFTVNVNVFYCKICSLLLNEESDLKLHTSTSSHKEKFKLFSEVSFALKLTCKKFNFKNAFS